MLHQLALLSALAASDGIDLSTPLSKGLAYGAVALGAWGWAGYELRNALGGMVVEAEVTGFSSYVDRGRDMYRAELKAVVDGREVTGRSQVGRTKESPAIGTKIRARYRASGPRAGLWEAGLITYVPGAVLFAVGVGFLLTAFGVIQ